MRGGTLGYPGAAVVFVLVCPLVLTACASAMQPEASAPSADSSQAVAATPAGGSVLDGVFTVQQASRGGTTFRRACVACHSISDFRGARFRLTWVGRTVGELFFVMSTLMPEGNPGSLSPEEYANIVSYMLSENGYPAGEVDLAADQPTLASIRIEAADR
jgi:mono/diheme cytochrome c family protein